MPVQASALPLGQIPDWPRAQCCLRFDSRLALQPSLAIAREGCPPVARQQRRLHLPPHNVLADDPVLGTSRFDPSTDRAPVHPGLRVGECHRVMSGVLPGAGLADYDVVVETPADHLAPLRVLAVAIGQHEVHWEDSIHRPIHTCDEYPVVPVSITDPYRSSRCSRVASTNAICHRHESVRLALGRAYRRWRARERERERG